MIYLQTYFPHLIQHTLFTYILLQIFLNTSGSIGAWKCTFPCPYDRREVTLPIGKKRESHKLFAKEEAINTASHKSLTPSSLCHKLEKALYIQIQKVNNFFISLHEILESVTSLSTLVSVCWLVRLLVGWLVGPSSARHNFLHFNTSIGALAKFLHSKNNAVTIFTRRAKT